jgi:hypothetical protein
MIARRSLHRTVFVAAGAYNLVWGLVSVVYPRWFYRLTGAPSARVEVFSALGMVVGLYGLLWPAPTLLVCLTNDFIWWFPFALYLIDAWPLFRADVAGRSRVSFSTDLNAPRTSR